MYEYFPTMFNYMNTSTGAYTYSLAYIHGGNAELGNFFGIVGYLLTTEQLLAIMPMPHHREQPREL